MEAVAESQTVTFADLFPQVDARQATAHIEALHGNAPDGWLSFVFLGNGTGRREQHAFAEIGATMRGRVRGVAAANSHSDLYDFVSQRWNVYAGCSLLRDKPERGRGKRADVASVPGVWADLDVRPDTEGAFRTAGDVAAFLARLPEPTMVVGSGSGGAHAYWLTDRRLDPKAGADLGAQWRDFLVEQADGTPLDNVTDTTRILRLAGTVRWPKARELAEPAPVVLLSADGPRYPAGDLAAWSADAHKQAKAHAAEMRKARKLADTDRMAGLDAVGVDLGRYPAAVSYFNQHQDWAELLEPTGWQLFSDDRDGAARCRYWVRPGKSVTDGKSASTDYVADDGTVSGAMSLYSSDPSLEDLAESACTAGLGICSKWHYARQRLFGGNDLELWLARRTSGVLTNGR